MTINMHEMAINGILSNFGYFLLHIISNETTIDNINAIYGLNNPLR